MAVIYCYAPLGAGHVNPTLGVVAELVRRGHDLTYWAPRAFAERIAETGARYAPVTSTWEAMGRDTLPQMHGRELVRAMGLLLDETEALVPVLARAAGRDRPDLVLHDGALAWWGRILAHRWDVPSVETWPNLVSNRHWSMNAYSKVNPLDPRFLRMILRIGRYLRRQGIRDVRGFTQGERAAQRLVTLPRAFQYAGDTFTDRYAFVGPCFTERGFQGEWRPPVSGAPVVLVSLGTAYNDRPEFYREVATSADGRPWHVVMVVGDQVDPASLGPLAANVEVHTEVPQLTVLRHARAFVTHAGMGSTMEGLAAGVPLVAIPQMAEQRANADRIAGLGLGQVLDPARSAPDALWEAVEDVAGDPDVRERLGWMRSEIAASGGAAVAADAVERALP
ncbi:macrolide family glycosyltransferase [Pseudonocardia sp. KRD291]|uniref:macrolide family glycosyltransferase n=1 Tax=Pseudonocardia sp. KRD291 TaxID=2792007 RepID=UPI001C4A109A|nr:macrolide family glycosyltransferase [Pseudonocardia sp. KRD291]MBW0102372.1 glycosyl transferase [Pseudonocardia sp. KRD291]